MTRRGPAALVAAAALAPLVAWAAQPTLKMPLEQTSPTLKINPPLVAPARPDLAIESVSVNAECKVVVTVVNRGPGTVPDSVWTVKTPESASVYLTAGGRPWGGRTIWHFDTARRLQGAGGRASVTLGYVVNGTVSVRVTVDHTAQVAEADEGNNARTASLTCADTPLPTLDRSGVRPLFGGGADASTAPPADQAAGADWEESWSQEPAAPAPLPPQSAGSLLDAPLPPPPQDLPPPPPREDRTVEPAEIVVASSNMAEAQALARSARGLGFGIRRRSNLQGLGLVMTVLRAPRGMSAGQALAALRQAVPSAWADANHRYTLQADRARSYARTLLGAGRPAPYCGRGVRIGMLDTGLAREHPALAGREIVTRSLLAAGIPRARPDHGTAVAALLVGNAQPSGFGGLVPAARLYAGEIFRQRDEEQVDTTAEWIVAGLDWLATQRVQIVNLSLGGPRNLLLEAAIARALELGIAVVAAGGNGGPDGPAVYPAAQRGVLAVTAVDAELAPYRQATRGAYLAFAAPGVDVWSAAPGKEGAYYSGTSYAAPFVTAVLAGLRQQSPETPWAALIERARESARDLGAPGRDPVFGWGLVQAVGDCGAGASARR